MPHPSTRAQVPDRALEANAYAVSYRLLGDRPAAGAVAGIAAERLRQSGGASGPGWLPELVQYTIDQVVRPDVLAGVSNADGDPEASLRAALRRRLENATRDERVAAALVHLAGYDAEFVGGLLGRSADEVARLAGVLAPPPGVVYRHLGDPELTRSQQPVVRRAPLRRRRLRWSTVLALAIVAAIVLAATQITGPRPTLEPRREGGWETPVAAADQRNGGPLTQQTRE